MKRIFKLKLLFLVFCFSLASNGETKKNVPPSNEELSKKVSMLEGDLYITKRDKSLLEIKADQYEGELNSFQWKYGRLINKIDKYFEETSSFKFISPLEYDAKLVKIIKCEKSGDDEDVSPFSKPAKYFFASEKGISPIKKNFKNNELKKLKTEEGETEYEIQYGEFTYDPKLLGQIGLILDTNDVKVTKYDEQFNDYFPTQADLNELGVFIPSKEDSRFASFKRTQDFRKGLLTKDCQFSKLGDFLRINCKSEDLYYDGLFYKKEYLTHGDIHHILGEAIIKKRRFFIMRTSSAGDKTTIVLVPEFGTEVVSQTLPCQ